MLKSRDSIDFFRQSNSEFFKLKIKKILVSTRRYEELESGRLGTSQIDSEHVDRQMRRMLRRFRV